MPRKSSIPTIQDTQSAQLPQIGSDGIGILSEAPDSQIKNEFNQRSPQIDSASRNITAENHENQLIADSDIAVPQTETGTDEELTGSTVQRLNISPVSQTEIEMPAQDEKSVITSGRRSKKSQSGDSATDSSEPRRRHTRGTQILTIDEQRTVETSADKQKTDLLDLVESQKSRKILTGTIQGVEQPPENANISFAVIYHGAFKIKQAGDNPYKQALKRYSPGSRYVGTVSIVDTNGVFVSLGGYV